MIKKFIFFLTATILSIRSADSSDLDNLWENSPLTFQYLKDVGLTEAICNQSFERFFACANGVNDALSFAGSAYQLRPDGWPELTPKSKLISDFGGMDLVQDTRTSEDLGTSRAKLLQALREEKALLFEKTKAVFEATGGSTTNWTEIFSYLEREDKPGVAPSLLNGYLEVADGPHTAVLPKKFLDFMKGSGDVELVGIGVRLAVVDKRFLVDSVIEGSPAEEVGLTSGDEILGVDGTTILGLSMTEAVKRVRGVEGTRVLIQYRRGNETREVEITRRKVIQRNVITSKIQARDRRIGYLSLADFTGESCKAVEAGIRGLEEWGQEAMILDLRNNGGGTLESAVCIAGLFVGPNLPIVFLKRDTFLGERVTRMQFSGERVTEKPLVVLVNAGSASASEIVSGALQDLDRAWIVGERTFGKGTAQGIRELSYQRLGGLRLKTLPDTLFKRTMDRYYLPSERSIEVLGVKPEIEVFRKPEPTEDDRAVQRQEDYYWFPVAKSEERSSIRSERSPQLKNCLEAEGVARRVYDSAPANGLKGDYQRLTALDVLHCETSGGLLSTK